MRTYTGGERSKAKKESTAVDFSAASANFSQKQMSALNGSSVSNAATTSLNSRKPSGTTSLASQISKKAALA